MSFDKRRRVIRGRKVSDLGTGLGFLGILIGYYVKVFVNCITEKIRGNNWGRVEEGVCRVIF